MNADVRELIARAKAHGWVHLSAGKHHRLRYPATGDVVIIPSTPSDWRSLRNSEALMRRISGRMSTPPGNGPSKDELRRRIERLRTPTSRRRRAVPVEPLRPQRTAMEVAFDDYAVTHDTELAHEVETLRRAG